MSNESDPPARRQEGHVGNRSVLARRRLSSPNGDDHCVEYLTSEDVDDILRGMMIRTDHFSALVRLSQVSHSGSDQIEYRLRKRVVEDIIRELDREKLAIFGQTLIRELINRIPHRREAGNG